MLGETKLNRARHEYANGYYARKLELGLAHGRRRCPSTDRVPMPSSTFPGWRRPRFSEQIQGYSQRFPVL